MYSNVRENAINCLCGYSLGRRRSPNALTPTTNCKCEMHSDTTCALVQRTTVSTRYYLQPGQCAVSINVPLVSRTVKDNKNIFIFIRSILLTHFTCSNCIHSAISWIESEYHMKTRVHVRTILELKVKNIIGNRHEVIVCSYRYTYCVFYRTWRRKGIHFWKKFHFTLAQTTK